MYFKNFKTLYDYMYSRGIGYLSDDKQLTVASNNVIYCISANGDCVIITNNNVFYLTNSNSYYISCDLIECENMISNLSLLEETTNNCFLLK